MASRQQRRASAFGYNIISSEYPPEPPSDLTSPPGNRPILSENESHGLLDFIDSFETVVSDRALMEDHTSRFFRGRMAGGEGFGWASDYIGPDFLLGTATYFGIEPSSQSPALTMSLDQLQPLSMAAQLSSSHVFPPPHQQMLAPQQHYPATFPRTLPGRFHHETPTLDGSQLSATLGHDGEALQAARVLEHGFSESHHDAAAIVHYRSPGTNRTVYPEAERIRHQNMEEFCLDSRHPAPELLPRSTSSSSSFDQASGPSGPDMIRWGTDRALTEPDAGYAPPPIKKPLGEVVDRAEGRSALKALGISVVDEVSSHSISSHSSVGETVFSPKRTYSRTSSDAPVQDVVLDDGLKATKKRKTGPADDRPGKSGKVVCADSPESLGPSQTVKGTLSTQDATGATAAATTTATTTATTASTAAAPAAAPARKRRRSSAKTPQKTPRENLTEEQKRRNHIQSEKRRRGEITVSFKQLENIVPEVRQSSGLSKAQKLSIAADWVGRLSAQNRRLTAQLDGLRSRAGITTQP